MKKWKVLLGTVALSLGLLFAVGSSSNVDAATWHNETPSVLRGKWETKPFKVRYYYDDGHKGWGQASWAYRITKHHIGGCQLQTDLLIGKVTKTNSSGPYYHVHSYTSFAGGAYMVDKIKRLSKNKLLIKSGNKNRVYYRVRHFHIYAKPLS